VSTIIEEPVVQTESQSETPDQAPEPYSAFRYTTNGDDVVEISAGVTVSSSVHRPEQVRLLAELARTEAMRASLDGALDTLRNLAEGRNDGAEQSLFDRQSALDHGGFQVAIQSTVAFVGPVLPSAQVQGALNDVNGMALAELGSRIDELNVLQAVEERRALKERLRAPMKEFIERLQSGREDVGDVVPPELNPEHWREFIASFPFCGNFCPSCCTDLLESLRYITTVESVTAQGVSEEVAEAIITNPTLKAYRDHVNGQDDDLSGVPADVTDYVQILRDSGLSAYVAMDPSGVSGRIVASPVPLPSDLVEELSTMRALR
jgi:uncharacterized coiled-coil protein SlyX